MNSYHCLQWVKEYGLINMDCITTDHAVRWIFDLAKESAYKNDDLDMIEQARRFHSSVLHGFNQLDMFKV